MRRLYSRMLSAILVQASSSVATVGNILPSGRRIPRWVPVLAAAIATSCSSISKRPALVIETAEPTPGDAAFSRKNMALRRGQAFTGQLSSNEARGATPGDAPDPLELGECFFPRAAN